MADYMDFQTFHTYNRLARRGIVDHLTCPDDGTRLQLMLGEHSEPVLHCWFCDSTLVPGLDLYNRVNAVVSEFTVREDD